MNWLDWVIIAVITLSALQGLRYGLVASVAGLAGLLAGIVVAFTYYQSLAGYLSQYWNIESIIKPAVREFLKIWLPSGDNVRPPLPEGKLTAGLGLAQSQFTALTEQLAGKVTTGVLEAISFLVLLLATAWLFNLAGCLLTKAVRIGFLGPLNHLGGFFFGAVKGLLVVMLILLLISPFQRADPPNSPLARGKAFQESALLPYFGPLFEAINRPLPGTPLLDPERKGRLLDA